MRSFTFSAVRRSLIGMQMKGKRMLIQIRLDRLGVEFPFWLLVVLVVKYDKVACFQTHIFWVNHAVKFYIAEHKTSS